MQSGLKISKDFYDHRSMPDSTSLPFEKNNKTSATGLDVPIPPSTMLQTWGQMANLNVYFCASFQVILAWPDGILCAWYILELQTGYSLKNPKVTITKTGTKTSPKLRYGIGKGYTITQGVDDKVFAVKE